MPPRWTALMVLFAAGGLQAQVCRLSVAGLNQSRRVMGPVSAECPVPFVFHTAPFGNWGVTSNFGPKLNGSQFEGWCHDSFACDNEGNCRRSCEDGWYEWNSCTDQSPYSAPNCSLYNASDCTEQVSTRGVNVLGTQTVDIPVACPYDANGDGVADAGGCKDVTTYSHGTNFMSLYELDPGGPDELIQTLYFPATPVRLQCEPLSCPPAGSDWAAPWFYDSPSFPAKVYAEMAVLVNSGTFIDPEGVCQFSGPVVISVSAASYSGAALAPESIVAAFGEDLAIATEAAAGTELPASLAGTVVRVTDRLGAVRLAPLFFVSPGQVNYLMPAGGALGNATVTVTSGSGAVSTGHNLIEAVAPGLFSANADGRGVAAAVAVRVKPDGSQIVEEVYRCGDMAGSCAPAPIDLDRAGDQVFLLLFGTGIRGGAQANLAIGGILADIWYFGPQGQYEGLDQVNVLLPQALRGAGTVNIELTVDGRQANPVTAAIR